MGPHPGAVTAMNKSSCLDQEAGFLEEMHRRAISDEEQAGGGGVLREPGWSSCKESNKLPVVLLH